MISGSTRAAASRIGSSSRERTLRAPATGGAGYKVAPADAALQTTLDWAADLAQRAPIAMSLTKQAMRDSFTQSLEETFSAEGPLQDECMASKDFVEGVTAFFEKRTARFSGD